MPLVSTSTDPTRDVHLRLRRVWPPQGKRSCTQRVSINYAFYRYASPNPALGAGFRLVFLALPLFPDIAPPARSETQRLGLTSGDKAQANRRRLHGDGLGRACLGDAIFAVDAAGVQLTVGVLRRNRLPIISLPALALGTEAADQVTIAHRAVDDLFGTIGRTQQIGHDGVLQFLPDFRRGRNGVYAALVVHVHLLGPVTSDYTLAPV